MVRTEIERERESLVLVRILADIVFLKQMFFPCSRITYVRAMLSCQWNILMKLKSPIPFHVLTDRSLHSSVQIFQGMLYFLNLISAVILRSFIMPVYRCQILVSSILLSMLWVDIYLQGVFLFLRFIFWWYVWVVFLRGSSILSSLMIRVLVIVFMLMCVSFLTVFSWHECIE